MHTSEAWDVDVILQDHDVTSLEAGIQASCSVGHNQGLNATKFHHPNRHSHLRMNEWMMKIFFTGCQFYFELVLYDNILKTVKWLEFSENASNY